MINLWVDDERPMPPNYTHHVKTAEEAIELLKTGNVLLISLDHDLGDGLTGYDIAKWIEEQAFLGKLQPFKLKVHSQNAVGALNIKRALQNAAKYWREKDGIYCS